MAYCLQRVGLDSGNVSAYHSISRDLIDSSRYMTWLHLRCSVTHLNIHVSTWLEATIQELEKRAAGNKLAALISKQNKGRVHVTAQQ